MSLEGKAAADKLLRGKINSLDVIYTDTYEIAVANGYKGTVEEWLAQLPTRMEMDEAVAQTENYCKQTAADSAVAVDAKAAALNAAEKAETKVESLLERNNKLPVSLWVGTQAEYDAITVKDETRLYIISDDTAIEDLVKKHSAPHNLLDNSDFTNPVNQRITTKATFGDEYCYFIDRWCVMAPGSANRTLEVVPNRGLSPYECNTLTLQQRFASGYFDLTNKVYTMVAYYEDGTIEVTVSNNQQYPNGKIAQDTGYDSVTFYLDTEKVISHLALYEGVYTAENAPVYRPKGYAVEQAECQLYFQNINKGVLNGYITNGGKSLCVSLPFVMKEEPQITCYGSEYTIRTVTGYYKGENIGAPSMCGYDDSDSMSPSNKFSVLVMQWDNGAVLGTNNTPASLEIRFGGGIELSADY
jgi:hypothetical protein